MTTGTTGRTSLAADMRRTLGWGALLALLLTLFIDGGALVVPLFDMQLYDRVLQSRNMDTVAALAVACALGLLLYALVDALRGALFALLADRWFARIAPALMAALVDRHAAGAARGGAELVSDLARMRGFLGAGGLTVALDGLCSPLLLAVLFLLHPAFGWLAIAGAALVLLLGVLTDTLCRAEIVAVDAARARLSQTMRERLASGELINALGMLPAIVRRWAASQTVLLRRTARVHARDNLIGGGGRVLRLGLQAGVMVLGAVLIVGGESSPGALMGANLLLNKFLNPYEHLVSGWRQWTLAHASWRRVMAALAAAVPTPAVASDTAGAPPAGLTVAGLTVAGLTVAGLTVAGVTLRDGAGRALLDGVSFRLAPGAAIGLAGGNGAGKSTLLRVLAGAVPPDAGTVRLDGAAVPGDGAAIGYMPQDNGLLDGTVRDNVARFRTADPEAIVRAATQAGAHEMIGRLSRGYDTALRGEGAGLGAGLSRGQAQRVALARALFGAPRLLLLDEPDASLDHEGEQELLRAIRAACARSAIVVVATHRKPLLASLDRVITLEHGRIAA
jgi:ATP-binding cassette subfamily C protein